MKFVVALLSLLKECVDKGEIRISGESKLQLSLEDTDKVGQILEICAILISAAYKDLSRNEKASTTLSSKIVSILPMLMSEFGKDPVCHEAVSIIISKLLTSFRHKTQETKTI